MSEIICGDALQTLKTLQDESVDCCITSPPYWGLRDYGTAKWEGGSLECDHKGNYMATHHKLHEGQPKDEFNREFYKEICGKCGAIRKDNQLGLEKTPEEYVAKMVGVFSDVRRVLKKEGTLWLNLGDSYYGSHSMGTCDPEDMGIQKHLSEVYGMANKRSWDKREDLKPKDLVGIPWRVAFALQADGWYLRQDLIWHKPNPMPESVTDRCTKAHEYIFLLAKGQSINRTIKVSDLLPDFFHFNENAGLQNPAVSGATLLCVRLASSFLDFAKLQKKLSLPPFYSQEWQNKADGIASDFVSNLPIEQRPLLEAVRFLNGQTSTKDFLQKIYSFGLSLSNSKQLLIGRTVMSLLDTPFIYPKGNTSIAINNASEICEFDFIHNTIVSQRNTTCKYYFDNKAILEPATTKENRPGGIQRDCLYNYNSKEKAMGKRKAIFHPEIYGDNDEKGMRRGRMRPEKSVYGRNPGLRNKRSVWKVNTRPFKGAHFATFPEALVEPMIKAGCPKGGTVLDPFAGAGTTLVVAKKLGRQYFGIELNKTFCDMAQKRIDNITDMFI